MIDKVIKSTDGEKSEKMDLNYSERAVSAECVRTKFSGIIMVL
jgi:hypothetical protein